MKRTLTILVFILTTIQVGAQSLCTTCTVTLSNYITTAGSERICITGSYTGSINVNNNPDAWICVTGTWAPTVAADYNGTANLKKLDVTGTLIAPGLTLNTTALTNSGTIHLTNGNLKMNGGGQGSSLTNTAAGAITIDNGDLIGPQGGTGFIDNSGSITLVAAGKKSVFYNYGSIITRNFAW